MNLSSGRIIFASKNSYKVLTEEGKEYLSVLSGNYDHHNTIMPTVGDYVQFYANIDGDSVIKMVLPRKSFLSRKNAGRKFEGQAIAANVDYLLIVNAMDSSFSKRRIERFMVLAYAGRVEPVLILSKVDKCPPLDMAIYLSDAEEVANGAHIIELSGLTGHGVEKLEKLLAEGKTACLVGMSGAGKSTLLNYLLGSDIRETFEVREDDERGRHCTTDRHLFRLKTGAAIIDSPGIREVGIQADSEAVADVFDEIKQYSAGCRFHDCTHIHEPDCAVMDAVDQKLISSERYESYLKLLKEAEFYKTKTEAPEELKRTAKQLSRLVRSAGKRKNRF